MKPEFLGEWHLIGYAYVDTHIGSGDPPDPVDIENWLLVAGVGLPEVEVRTGLELVIRDDASYSERVVSSNLPMLWYDSEGVQVDSPVPTAGTIREVVGRDGASLHPHSAHAPAIRNEEGLRGVLRYDDGDTMVSDILRIVGDSLIRAISVVTDEIYFNRVVAHYGRPSNV